MFDQVINSHYFPIKTGDLLWFSLNRDAGRAQLTQILMAPDKKEKLKNFITKERENLGWVVAVDVPNRVMLCLGYEVEPFDGGEVTWYPYNEHDDATFKINDIDKITIISLMNEDCPVLYEVEL